MLAAIEIPTLETRANHYRAMTSCRAGKTAISALAGACCLFCLAGCEQAPTTMQEAPDAGVQSAGNGGESPHPNGSGGPASPSEAGRSGAPTVSNTGNAGAPEAGAMGVAGARPPEAPPDAGAQPPRTGIRAMGKSAGCTKLAPSTDSSTKFIKHDIAVTGVDPAFIAAHPAANGGNWSARSYYLRLPSGYDPVKPYPVTFGGAGCGNTDGTSGNSGGLAALPNGQKEAIQVGLNYMYPQNAGACFADDFTNTPDLPYFDAILAELEANYCIDQDRVFVDGFSSGAWETYLLGCARAGIVRGIGTAAGGLRKTRPACTEVPVAAILVAGLQDMENPIGPLAPPGKNDSLGSAPARDDILARNGCIGTATTPWDPKYPACLKYTGCPDAYPVVWCAIDAGHGNGGDISATGFWKFWSALPSP